MIGRKSPLRLALMPQPTRTWMGGVNYFSNLITVLTRFVPDRIQPVLFVGTQTDQELVQMLTVDGVEIVRRPEFDASAIRRRTIAALAGFPDRTSAAAFTEARIDAVFETMAFLGSRPPVSSLAWFPDFQHRRLPMFFPWHVRARRDLLVRRLLAGQRMLMLSSKDAQSDAERFFDAKGRTEVVNFALPTPPALAKDWRPNPALNLPERYFYLPNQMWKHKNHELVVDALAMLPAANRPTIVLTGATHDPKAPGVLAHLQERARHAGVAGSMRFLGLQPYGDVQGMMHKAIAVINPSRFEGWSTTVEECIAIGSAMLLSDIPVHREQADGIASFFGVDDPAALAALLDKADAGATMPRSNPLLADARATMFAQRFASAIEAVHQLG